MRFPQECRATRCSVLTCRVPFVADDSVSFLSTQPGSFTELRPDRRVRTEPRLTDRLRTALAREILIASSDCAIRDTGGCSRVGAFPYARQAACQRMVVIACSGTTCLLAP